LEVRQSSVACESERTEPQGLRGNVMALNALIMKTLDARTEYFKPFCPFMDKANKHV